MLPADEAVRTMLHALPGRPGYLVGSAVAAQVYGLPYAYSDVDVFVPSPIALASTVQLLLEQSAVMDAQEQRKWERWQVDPDFGSWHTNSIKLETINGVEANIVFKTVGRSPLTSIHAVLGSFDFGYVAMGYDLRSGILHDGREFWFGRHADMDHLGLLPDRDRAWNNASVGRFTGIRQAQRWAKFAARGYDMAPSAPVLAKGYRLTAAHYLTKDDPEYHGYAEVYGMLADLIEDGAIHDLQEAYDQLQHHDPVNSLRKGLA